MNDIDFRLAEAERLASETIDEFGIRSPEHIRIRDIAFAKGALVIEQNLTGAVASIVKVGTSATIRIPPTDAMERKRFSIAHELGHLLLGHIVSIKKACSDGDMMNWYQTNHETQANFFASELILPTKLVRSKCDTKNISFKPIKQLSKDFRTSLTATAIKFVRWPFIHKNQKLDKRTLAYDFFAGEPMEPEPAEVDADAWVESRGLDEIVEHSIASSQYGFVLSLLWVKS